jgi:hypothetical protein
MILRIWAAGSLAAELADGASATQLTMMAAARSRMDFLKLYLLPLE